MAKARKNISESPTFKPKDARPKLFYGLFALLLSVLIPMALFDYNPNQNPVFDSDPIDTNMVGQLGVWVAYFSLRFIGFASYILPICTLWVAYIYFRPYAYKMKLNKMVSLVFLLISVAVFGSMGQIEHKLELEMGAVSLEEVSSNLYPNGWGGAIGHLLYGDYLRVLLGKVGTFVVFFIIFSFALFLLTYDNLVKDIRLLLGVKLGEWAETREERSREKAEKRAIAKAQKEAKAKQKELAKRAAAAKKKAKKAVLEESTPPPQKRSKGLGFGKKKEVEESSDSPPPFSPIMEAEEGVRATPPSSEPEKEKATGKISLGTKKSKTPSSAAGLKIIASEQTKKASVVRPEQSGDYKFPPMHLIAESVQSEENEDLTYHQTTADNLVKTLDEFGVKVTPGEVHTGPVITRYDVFPAAGVRVEKIVNLDKNLALGLKATSVRILAPVPGRGCVGIEVPNKNPQAVYIRDILESEDWVNTKAEIPIALGKEVSGRPMIADLTKMPHLLIAGSTGSGKTVCINSIITSLLYHSSPDDLRFVMVDPKIVEMQVYNSLPHMLVPVVTDPKKVPNALKYLLNEMEKRYQTFAQIGVRNIAGYNAKMAKDRTERKAAEERAAEMDAEMTAEERAAASTIEVPRDLEATGELPTKLPYIVCIVDELADLMMVAPADIETGIARLAQLARAAGIHLILATQRPSVNVITGVIKANLPSRIAFKVASKVDSRTILDTMGADHLIGKGDMLFLPPGSADLVRAQGAFVGDDEINGIVEHIAEINGKPTFDEEFQKNIEAGVSDSGGAEGEWDDELVPDAIDVIRNSKRASTSMLQRRLKIGYNRAARIMELLEAEGMVGPENGSSPREILMDLD